MANKFQTAAFGGGCFWCTEAVFRRLKGVESVIPGYAGGIKENPSYEEVSSESTGHAEAIQVKFDPGIIFYDQLLNVFFATHNPTTLNRQGGDAGEQYRSVIFYSSDDQRQSAESFLEKLETDHVFDAPVVTEIKSLDKFYEAEDYHHEYYEKNKNKPYCAAVINPKVAKLRQQFSDLLKS
ncbi:MAG: peptide-methionine (S)-S-oxide reductase MsrA [bacterium]|nr:peptide-methionine (S)-S-oxide reductase MsrA [bacterium]